MEATMRDRKDWHWWRLHIIKRGYRDDPQYGFILWGMRRNTPTLDVWIKRTLWTVRVNRDY